MHSSNVPSFPQQEYRELEVDPKLHEKADVEIHESTVKSDEGEFSCTKPTLFGPQLGLGNTFGGAHKRNL